MYIANGGPSRERGSRRVLLGLRRALCAALAVAGVGGRWDACGGCLWEKVAAPAAPRRVCPGPSEGCTRTNATRRLPHHQPALSPAGLRGPRGVALVGVCRSIPTTVPAAPTRPGEPASCKQRPRPVPVFDERSCQASAQPASLHGADRLTAFSVSLRSPPALRLGCARTALSFHCSPAPWARRLCVHAWRTYRRRRRPLHLGIRCPEHHVRKHHHTGDH